MSSIGAIEDMRESSTLHFRLSGNKMLVAASLAPVAEEESEVLLRGGRESSCGATLRSTRHHPAARRIKASVNSVRAPAPPLSAGQRGLFTYLLK